MSYRLAPHIYVALVDDQAISLDLARDRYSRLGKGAARAYRDWSEGRLASADAERLCALGILEPGLQSDDRIVLPPLPTRSALETERLDTDGPGFALVTAELLRWMFLLRRRGLAATLSRACLVSALPNCETHALMGFSQTFVGHRSSLPFRHICLPDSLALRRLLSRRDLYASIVFGVRLDPFAAHCWVQADDLVLNDSCDGVARFTPILAL